MKDFGMDHFWNGLSQISPNYKKEKLVNCTKSGSGSVNHVVYSQCSGPYLYAVAEVIWLPVRAMSLLSLTFATLKVDDISVVTYARLGYM